MHPNALITICSELLQEVLQFKMPADALLSNYFRAHKALGQRDRHALTETVFLVLRQRLTWQHLAQSNEGKRLGSLPRRLALLAWQGTPGVVQAACSEAERTWRELALAVDRSAFQDKLKHNLPDWLAHALQAQMPESEFWALCAALDGPGPLDVRVNILQAKRPAIAEELKAAGLDCELTPYSPWGLRLIGKPALQKIDAFMRGDLEIQDEGSQLLALLLGPKRGEMVVDFCAGAGGKTLALGAMMRGTGRLYALDISGHRLDALKPRLARSGLSNVYPIQISHERDERIKRLYGKIDRVLVDAPCSGLGTLRRNPDRKWRLSGAAIQDYQTQQIALLASAVQLLKPGGRLVYATCSLLHAENEAVAEHFSQAHPDMQPLTLSQACKELPFSATFTDSGYLRLWPHIHQTDGYFASVWERQS